MRDLKILFASDIHGSIFHLKMLKDIYIKENADRVIILDDIFPYGYYDVDFDRKEYLDLLSSFNNLYLIRGNCDSDLDIETSNQTFFDSFMISVGGKTLYCTHGNIYNSYNLPNSFFDIMVYGHLHKGFISKKDNHVFANPGSIAFPRGGSVNSYLIVTDKMIFFKDLSGNVIDSLNLEEI